MSEILSMVNVAMQRAAKTSEYIKNRTNLESNCVVKIKPRNLQQNQIVFIEMMAETKCLTYLVLYTSMLCILSCWLLHKRRYQDWISWTAGRRQNGKVYLDSNRTPSFIYITIQNVLQGPIDRGRAFQAEQWNQIVDCSCFCSLRGILSLSPMLCWAINTTTKKKSYYTHSNANANTNKHQLSGTSWFLFFPWTQNP